MDGLKSVNLLANKNFLTEFRYWRKFLIEVVILIALLAIILVNPVERSYRYELDDETIRRVAFYDKESLERLEIFREERRIKSEKVKLNLAYSPQLPAIKRIMEKVVEKLKLRKAVGYDDPFVMEAKFKNKTTFAAVEFPEYSKFGTKKLTLVIRFPSTFRTVQTENVKDTIWLTRCNGILSKDVRNSENIDTDLYLREGFLQLQHQIFMNWLTEVGITVDLPIAIRSFRHEVNPYGCDVATTGSNLVFLLFFMCFLYPFLNLIERFGYEKENHVFVHHLKFGIGYHHHWIAHFIVAFIHFLILIFIVILFGTIRWSYDDFTYNFGKNFLLFLPFFVLYITALIITAMTLVCLVPVKRNAVLLGCLLWIVSYGMFAIILNHTESLAGFWVNLTFLLFFNNTFAFSMKYLRDYKSETKGAEVCFLYGALIVNILLHLTLLWHFQYFWPGRYVLQGPYNFLNLRKMCSRESEKEELSESFSETSRISILLGLNWANVENVPIDSYALVSLKNVCTFVNVGGRKSRIKLKNISMKIYRGEVTMILGHNNCGKTTLISMMAGRHNPENGEVLMNGIDLYKYWDDARKHFDVCMPETPLFDMLTAAEVLHYYFLIKINNADPTLLKIEMNKWLHHLRDVVPDSQIYVHQMTYDQKRLVFLCCTLSCDTEVILLDEPTQQMRWRESNLYWQILHQEKPNRAIIVTSNSIDMTDRYADRILIMHDGMSLAYGTKFFLKTSFGLAYRLTILKDPTTPITQITNRINKHIKGVKPEDVIGDQVFYKLSKDKTADFQRLLINLEKDATELGIRSISLFGSELFDVYMNLGMQLNKQEIQDKLFEPQTIHLLKDKELRSQQKYAMAYKKIICQAPSVIPLIMMFAAFILIMAINRMSKVLKVPPKEEITLKLGLDAHDNGEFLQPLVDCRTIVMDHVVTTKGSKRLISKNFNRKSLYCVETKTYVEHVTEDKYIHYTFGGVEKDPVNGYTVWFNQRIFHSAPLALNLLHNLILSSNNITPYKDVETEEENNPDEDNSDEDNPDEDNPDKDNPDKDNPDRDNPDKDNPVKDNPDNDNPDKDNPEKDNPDKNNPDKNNPDNESLEDDEIEQHAESEKTAGIDKNSENNKSDRKQNYAAIDKSAKKDFGINESKKKDENKVNTDKSTKKVAKSDKTVQPDKKGVKIDELTEKGSNTSDKPTEFSVKIGKSREKYAEIAKGIDIDKTTEKKSKIGKSIEVDAENSIKKVVDIDKSIVKNTETNELTKKGADIDKPTKTEKDAKTDERRKKGADIDKPKETERNAKTDEPTENDAEIHKTNKTEKAAETYETTQKYADIDKPKEKIDKSTEKNTNTPTEKDAEHYKSIKKTTKTADKPTENDAETAELIMQDDPKEQLYTTYLINNPMPIPLETKINLLEMQLHHLVLPLSVGIIMPITVSSFIFQLIEERETHFLMLVRIAGLKLRTYWFMTYLWDELTFVAYSVFYIIVMTFSTIDGFRMNDKFVIMLLFFIYGLSAIPMTYFVSLFCYGSRLSAFLKSCIVHVLTGLFFYIIYWDVIDNADWFYFIAMIFPSFALLEALSNMYTEVKQEQYCDYTCKNIIGCSEENICNQIHYCCFDTYFKWKNPGILPSIVCLIFSGFVYIGLLSWIEVYRNENRFATAKDLNFYRTACYPYDDPDVVAVKKRIAQLDLRAIKRERFAVDQLECEIPKDCLSLHTVSFGVKKGQCLAIWAPRRSGKTHLVKQMIGQDSFSFGDIVIHGKELKYESSQVYSILGYCPQSRGAFSNISPRELLQIFCMIRGIPEEKTEEFITDMKKALNMRGFMNTKFNNLSHDKRSKALVALSLLLNNKVIVLDEPTRGLSALSRSQIYNVIRHARYFGKTLIFTNVSTPSCYFMADECILFEDGEMLAIGSLQYLRQKYARGFYLEVKLKLDGMDHDEALSNLNKDIENLHRFVAYIHEGSELRSQCGNVLKYYCPVNNLIFSSLYGTLEKNRRRLNILGYLVTQGSIDDAFSNVTATRLHKQNLYPACTIKKPK